MIFENIERLEQYAAVRERCFSALKKIKNGEFDQLLPGKYDIGDKMFVAVQEYNTAGAETQRFEVHRQTVEIIYIAEGAERVLTCEANELGKAMKEYEPDRDRAFFADPPEWSSHLLQSGQYIVVFPKEGHKTRCNPEIVKSSKVRKYLVKMAL